MSGQDNKTTGTRVYYTPQRLNKMDPDLSALWPRCKTEIGYLVHMFWSCSHLKEFWKIVKNTTEKMTVFYFGINYTQDGIIGR